MDIREYFQDVQENRLTSEQWVLADEFRLIIENKTESVVRDWTLKGLVALGDEQKHHLIRFEVATFFVSWVEWAALSAQNAASGRMDEIKIVLLTVRLTFCKKMMDEKPIAGRSMEYWMDRMLGRCREYWGQIRLEDPEARTCLSNMLLDHLHEHAKESFAAYTVIRRSIEQGLVTLPYMIQARLSRHGFSGLP